MKSEATSKFLKDVSSYLNNSDNIPSHSLPQDEANIVKESVKESVESIQNIFNTASYKDLLQKITSVQEQKSDDQFAEHIACVSHNESDDIDYDKELNEDTVREIPCISNLLEHLKIKKDTDACKELISKLVREKTSKCTCFECP